MQMRNKGGLNVVLTDGRPRARAAHDTERPDRSDRN
jgi:hypothetical protein